MDKKEVPTFKNLSSRRRNIIIVTTLLAAVILIASIFQIVKPNRSIASYCKVYKEQDAKLAKAQGDTYSVTVFSHSSSNPADFANAFSELEEVAPGDIQPDIKTLKQLFQKIDSDPSQSMSASLSGLGAESSVKEWTVQNCHL